MLGHRQYRVELDPFSGYQNLPISVLASVVEGEGDLRADLLVVLAPSQFFHLDLLGANWDEVLSVVCFHSYSSSFE